MTFDEVPLFFFTRVLMYLGEYVPIAEPLAFLPCSWILPLVSLSILVAISLSKVSMLAGVASLENLLMN